MITAAPSHSRSPVWEPIVEAPRRAAAFVSRYWKALVETIKEIWGKWTVPLFAACNYVAPTLAARAAALWMYARQVCERAGREADKERYESEIVCLKQTQAELQCRLDQLKMDHGGQAQVARDNEVAIARLKQDLEAANKVREQKAHDIGALSSRVAYCTQSAADAVDRAAQATRQRDEAISQKTQAEQILIGLKRELEQAKQALSTIETQNKQAQDTIASLKVRLQNALSQDRGASKRVEHLHADLNKRLETLIEVCKGDCADGAPDSAIQPFLESAKKGRESILIWLQQVKEKIDSQHAAQLDLAAIEEALSSEAKLVESIIAVCRCSTVSTASSSRIEIYPFNPATQTMWV